MFDDRQSKVQAKALEVAVMLFENMIESEQVFHLSATDYKVFYNYIMPQFTKLQKNHKEDQLVQVTYTRYLPILAKVGHKFTEIALASKLAKKHHVHKSNEEEKEAAASAEDMSDTSDREYQSFIESGIGARSHQKSSNST